MSEQDIESLLKQLSLRTPSDRLDQQVLDAMPAEASQAPLASTIQQNELEHRALPPVKAGPSWPFTIAACAACLLIGLFAGKREVAFDPAGQSPLSTNSTDEGSVDDRRTVVSDGSFVLINGIYPARQYQTETIQLDRRDELMAGAPADRQTRSVLTLSQGI